MFQLKSLLDEISGNFQNFYSSELAVDFNESLIPFRGRLNFNHYKPGKCHEYTCKQYKLCSPNCYTWNIQIFVLKKFKFSFSLGHTGSKS